MTLPSSAVTAAADNPAAAPLDDDDDDDDDKPGAEEVQSSGYPTLTIQFHCAAVAFAHAVEGPEQVGSRKGRMAASEGKL